MKHDFTVISEATNAYLRAPLRPPPQRVYLAGPMRDHPAFNFPAFHAAAAKLRAEGYIVFNPAEKDEDRHGVDFAKRFGTGDIEAAMREGFSLRTALGEDLAWICEQADAIALLPGWENSKGACAERATAVALGLRIILLEDIK